MSARVCEFCGNTYHVSDLFRSTQKYCSTTCRGRAGKAREDAERLLREAAKKPAPEPTPEPKRVGRPPRAIPRAKPSKSGREYAAAGMTLAQLRRHLENERQAKARKVARASTMAEAERMHSDG
jgi:hypothetical protein